MEAGGGPGSDDLTHFRQLVETPARYHLFHALRVIEARYADAPRLGESRRSHQDRVRLGQVPELAFPPATITSFRPGEDGVPGRLANQFFGLFGPHGPLPLHMTEYARDRLRNHRDPTLVAFADMLTHRLMSLLYRVWAAAQPAPSFDRAWIPAGDGEDGGPEAGGPGGVGPAAGSAASGGGAVRGPAAGGPGAHGTAGGMARGGASPGGMGSLPGPGGAGSGLAGGQDAGGLPARRGAAGTGGAGAVAHGAPERTQAPGIARETGGHGGAAPVRGGAGEDRAEAAGPADPPAADGAGGDRAGEGAAAAGAGGSVAGQPDATGIPAAAAGAGAARPPGGPFGVAEAGVSGRPDDPVAPAGSGDDFDPDRTVVRPRSARAGGVVAAAPAAPGPTPEASAAASTHDSPAFDPDRTLVRPAAARSGSGVGDSAGEDAVRRDDPFAAGAGDPAAGAGREAAAPEAAGHGTAGRVTEAAQAGIASPRATGGPAAMGVGPGAAATARGGPSGSDPAGAGNHAGQEAADRGAGLAGEAGPDPASGRGDAMAADRGAEAREQGPEALPPGTGTAPDPGGAPAPDAPAPRSPSSRPAAPVRPAGGLWDAALRDPLQPTTVLPLRGANLAARTSGPAQPPAVHPGQSGGPSGGQTAGRAGGQSGGPVTGLTRGAVGAYVAEPDRTGRKRPRRRGKLNFAADAVQRKVAALAGYGTGAMDEADAMPDLSKRHFAGLLSSGPKHAEGLRSILSAFFQAPVELQQFVGHWLTLEGDDTWRLGQSGLGMGTSIGTRVWSRDSKFRIKVGPLDLKTYQRLLPGRGAIERMEAIVRNYVGDRLAWDVQLILKAEEVPRVALGMRAGLGYNTWAGRRRDIKRDADDLILTPPSQTAAARALAGH